MSVISEIRYICVHYNWFAVVDMTINALCHTLGLAML
jgi:hypothetical protein